ncbi:hypothetical protein PVAND_014816 [Polypedilum vanderplanki]|uniref:C2H2-type domain-containing protein n=1 Tax=Polypedilum vanderplanki TaxID=319348 RepID=A0A9J6BB39_POLVA|nr:hypothetical protein PVAND_014816 [Polypedilum vanderplanki]
MKVNNYRQYHRNESLRIHVLRKTIPQLYFKQKSKLLRTVTRELAIKILNEVKICSKMLKKKKKDQKTPEKSSFSNCKKLAINFVNRINLMSPQKKIDSGERKTIIDEKSDASGYFSALPAYQQISTPTAATSDSAMPSENFRKTAILYNRFARDNLKNFDFICEYCGNTYTSVKRLQNHYEKCNVLHPSSEGLICCKICKKNFKTTGGYTNHMMKFHSEENEIKTIEITQEEGPMDVEENLKTNEIKKESIFHSIELLAKSDG